MMDIQLNVLELLGHHEGDELKSLFAIMRNLDAINVTPNGQLEEISVSKMGVSKIAGDHFSELLDLLHRAEEKYPIRLKSPFEGCETIAGGLWAEGTLDSNQHPPIVDAIIKLKWAPNTMDLPAHIHEGSSRVVLVTKGGGYFHSSNDAFEDFSGRNLVTTAISAGNIIRFSSDYIHTFSTDGASELEFLSYHNPYFDLDDPRQYTLTPIVWHPSFFHKKLLA